MNIINASNNRECIGRFLSLDVRRVFFFRQFFSFFLSLRANKSIIHVSDESEAFFQDTRSRVAVDKIRMRLCDVIDRRVLYVYMFFFDDFHDYF